MIKRTILVAALILSVAFSTGNTLCAPKIPFNLEKIILKNRSDVSKLGKGSRVALKAADRAAIIKRMPGLASSSDNLLKGAVSIERAISKAPAAKSLIELGANPARVTTLVQTMPGAVSTGATVASQFTRVSGKAADLTKFSPAAAKAFRKYSGNAAAAADDFVEMAKRAGKGAVDVAKRLADFVAKNPKSTVASVLLAWHIADPEGAEETIKSFFKDHVFPLGKTPIEGIEEGMEETIESIANTTGNAADRVTGSIEKLVADHLGSFLVLLAIILLWKLPALRKLPFNILNSCFEKINNRFESDKNTKMSQATPDNRLRANVDSSYVNIYKPRSRKNG